MKMSRRGSQQRRQIPHLPLCKGAGPQDRGILPFVEFSMSVQEKLGLPEAIFIGSSGFRVVK
jgi:hypothetical protein